MSRPMACVWSRKIRPSVFSISPKYSCGFTRTRAPVGQFSSHEYAGREVPDGLSGVFSQRLHLIATMSSPSAAVASAAGEPIPKTVFSRSRKFGEVVTFSLRGTIEIALYGHCVAQSKQPMHVAGSISTCPFGSRKIAPVGQPVRHSGSLQCMQTDGDSMCCVFSLFGLIGRSM